MSERRRVVITGMGLVTPLGNGVSTVWPQLVAGACGIRTISIIDHSRHKVHIAGEIPDWNPIPRLQPKDVKRIDRFAQFALVAAAEAIEQSGVDFSQEDPWRCGVILGSGIGGLTEMEDQTARLLEKGPDRVSAMTIPKLIMNAGSAHISIENGLCGVNTTVATACASSNNALGDALHAIRHGIADVVVSGGAEAAITRMSLAAFANMRALTTREDPRTASRPYDADRDGFVMAEGAGMVVLEEYERARRRGAPIFGELIGVGYSGDAVHITQPHEEGAGAAKAMANALSDAGVAPEEVDYINAHGTSTPLGDKAETLAIKRVFGEHAYRLSVSSTKSQLGHALGASGGIELIAGLMTMQDGVIPPTINLDTPDPDCDLDYTPRVARERKVETLLSNSFGFGGHNACILVRRV